jgi:hypothetical protein
MYLVRLRDNIFVEKNKVINTGSRLSINRLTKINYVDTNRNKYLHKEYEFKTNKDVNKNICYKNQEILDYGVLSSFFNKKNLTILNPYFKFNKFTIRAIKILLYKDSIYNSYQESTLTNKKKLNILSYCLLPSESNINDNIKISVSNFDTLNNASHDKKNSLLMILVMK